MYLFNGKKFEGTKNLSGKDAMQVLMLFIFKTEKDSFLIANTIKGMYVVYNNRAVLIRDLSFESIVMSDFFPETAYLTSGYGLYKITYKNNAFSKPEKIKNFNNIIYTGKEVNRNNMLLLIENKPVLFNVKTKKLTINTEISDFIKINDKIYALTKKGIYIFNKNTESFTKDTAYLSYPVKETEILKFTKFGKNKYWVLAKRNNKTFIAKIIKTGNKYTSEISPYTRLTSVNTFYADGDSLLWANSNKKLFKYNISSFKDFSKKENCLIRTVKLNNDSVIYGGYLPENFKKTVSDYHFNNYYFEFALTSFDGEKNEYSYKLENGKSVPWSGWTETNFKEYTNLYEGKYIFTVKGRNIYGIESDPVSFEFEILPPLFRSIPAYFAYLVLLTLFIRTLIKLNAKRLEKENIRLDNIVKERTAEILTQKEEIQTQTDYLEEINTELNQKNEEISTIAENLKAANTKINEKNKYILSSINYAQKIQNAVLPSEKEISEYISDFFIIFKPKDIVSGDFYFVKKRGNHLIIAVADCTGHGVPGGFLAMMGIAVLSDVIQDPKITNPAAALEKMQSIIKQSLRQNKYLDSQNDGIEIALCAINTNDLTLKFAGANHPLYIARKKENTDISGITELPADSQPVGIHYREQPFTLKRFNLKEGDMIYMFTDGYFDQFGGQGKKKFMLKNLTTLLKEVSESSVKIQKRKILTAFNLWKGNNKQVDDDLLIGIRVKNFK